MALTRLIQIAYDRIWNFPAGADLTVFTFSVGNKPAERLGYDWILCRLRLDKPLPKAHELAVP